MRLSGRADGSYRLIVTGACGNAVGEIHVRGGAALLVQRDNVDIDHVSLVSDKGNALQIEANSVRVARISASKSKNGVVLKTKTEMSNVSISHSNIEDNRYVGLKLDEHLPGRIYRHLMISNNVIEKNGNHGIRIWFRPPATRSSYLVGAQILGNRVSGNGGDGIVLVHQGANEEDPRPVLSNVIISDNRVDHNTGGIAVRGLTASTYFASSKISGNTIRDNRGVTGGINIFWSRGVLISSNEICCNHTDRIDGNGILLDHGNQDIRVIGNTIRSNDGNRIPNSGAGVMVLDDKNILIENNTIRNNWVGIFLGGRRPARNIVIRNNDIRGSVSQAVHFHQGYDKRNVEFKGNRWR